jgi:hypothetical protein
LQEEHFAAIDAAASSVQQRPAETASELTLTAYMHANPDSIDRTSQKNDKLVGGRIRVKLGQFETEWHQMFGAPGTVDDIPAW